MKHDNMRYSECGMKHDNTRCSECGMKHDNMRERESLLAHSPDQMKLELNPDSYPWETSSGLIAVW